MPPRLRLYCAFRRGYSLHPTIWAFRGICMHPVVGLSLQKENRSRRFTSNRQIGPFRQVFPKLRLVQALTFRWLLGFLAHLLCFSSCLARGGLP